MYKKFISLGRGLGKDFTERERKCLSTSSRCRWVCPISVISGGERRLFVFITFHVNHPVFTSVVLFRQLNEDSHEYCMKERTPSVCWCFSRMILQLRLCNERRYGRSSCLLSVSSQSGIYSPSFMTVTINLNGFVNFETSIYITLAHIQQQQNCRKERQKYAHCAIIGKWNAKLEE